MDPLESSARIFVNRKLNLSACFKWESIFDESFKHIPVHWELWNIIVNNSDLDIKDAPTIILGIFIASIFIPVSELDNTS